MRQKNMDLKILQASKEEIKINITKDATRREEGIPEGKGRPGVKRTKAEREAIKKGHWANN